MRAGQRCSQDQVQQQTEAKLQRAGFREERELDFRVPRPRGPTLPPWGSQLARYQLNTLLSRTASQAPFL